MCNKIVELKALKTIVTYSLSFIYINIYAEIVLTTVMCNKIVELKALKTIVTYSLSFIYIYIYAEIVLTTVMYNKIVELKACIKMTHFSFPRFRIIFIRFIAYFTFFDIHFLSICKRKNLRYYLMEKQNKNQCRSQEH